MVYEVRRLRLLWELAARGTIAATAEACSLTPSAVSQQLSLLERETGTPLLLREGRRLVLTEAAHILVRHTDGILAELERARSEVASLNSSVRGTVRLSSFPSATVALASPAIATCRTAHPDLRIQLDEAEPEQCGTDLRQQRTDVALVYEYNLLPRLRDDSIRLTPLVEEPLLAALPQDTPTQLHSGAHTSAAQGDAVSQANRPTGRPSTELPGGKATADEPVPNPPFGQIPLARLSSQPWIAPRSDTSLRTVLDRACQSAGFTPQLDYTSDDYTVIMSLVQAGLGVSLMPRLIAEPLQADVHLCEVTELRLTRTISTAVRAGAESDPAVAALTAALRAAATHRNIPGPSAPSAR